MRRIVFFILVVQLTSGCGKHSDGNPEMKPNAGILSQGHSIEGSIATEGGGSADTVNKQFWNEIQELSVCLLTIGEKGKRSTNDLYLLASYAGDKVRSYEEMNMPMSYHFNSSPPIAITRHPEGRVNSDDFSRFAKLHVSYDLFPTTPLVTEQLYIEFMHFALKDNTAHLTISPVRMNQMIELLAHLCSHDGTL